MTCAAPLHANTLSNGCPSQAVPTTLHLAVPAALVVCRWQPGKGLKSAGAGAAGPGRQPTRAASGTSSPTAPAVAAKPAVRKAPHQEGQGSGGPIHQPAARAAAAHGNGRY